MVSGIGTSSGFEERIRFSEIEIVDSNAIDTGVLHTMPEGNYINGWDVNVAGVRATSVKRSIRHHKHAEFLLRIKRKGELEHFVGRRYGDFAKLSKRLRTELPGRVLPQLPRKNKSSSTASGFLSALTNGDGDDSDASSLSSMSTRLAPAPSDSDVAAPGLLSPTGGETRCRSGGAANVLNGEAGQISSRRPGSIASARSMRSRASPRPSVEGRRSPGNGSGTPDNRDEVRVSRTLSPRPAIFSPDAPPPPPRQAIVLWREGQRTSLRAWLRSLLHNPQVANTKAVLQFLSGDPVTPTDEDVDDIVRRKAVDEKRIREQQKFYEVARKRAAELDEYMEQ